MKKPLNKIKICVSGAAVTTHCGPHSLEMAEELGKQIALHDAVITTGATTAFPLWAAMGAKEAGGFSIGLSPASTEKEHVEVYRLPLDYLDVIIYTGFGFSGRNLLLTRSSDAVIIGCGRIGTINEFTIAYEDEKPVGVLQSDEWKTDEVIQYIIKEGHRVNKQIIFDTDPKRLVERIIEMVEHDKKKELRYNNHDPRMIPHYIK